MKLEEKVKKLLATYKRRIRRDNLAEIDKGLVKTYLEEFAKDLLAKK